MVAKLIVHDSGRDLALNRMNRALDELVIEGIKTNRGQQKFVINHAVFRSGNFGTSWYAEIAKEAEDAL
jgi:acetyl-CoA carboxylase biotin carboxylase subunit